MPTTLETRLQRAKKLEQRRAEYEEKEQRRKEAARREQVGLWIALGKLVEKRGLSKLNADELEGALMSLEAGAQDPKTRRAWRKAAHAGEAIDAEPPPAEQPSVTLPTLVAVPAAAE